MKPLLSMAGLAALVWCFASGCDDNEAGAPSVDAATVPPASLDAGVDVAANSDTGTMSLSATILGPELVPSSFDLETELLLPSEASFPADLLPPRL
jgi:hypothetical protein